MSKRLAEVNEELNKSQARNASLQKDLEDTKQLLKNEETKSAELGEQMKGLTAAESSFNSLTANLQEATARVSELENTLTGFENQLKASQEKQLQKDKEIQVCFFSTIQYMYMSRYCLSLVHTTDIMAKSRKYKTQLVSMFDATSVNNSCSHSQLLKRVM